MRLSGTRVTAIAQGRGFGNQLWDLAGVPPSLDLRFAENKSLVDATTGSNLVTFTRASSGTYVDSDGLIKTATTNLQRWSEDFTQGLTPTNATLTANQGVAPNGTLTADQLLETTTNGLHSQEIVDHIFIAGATYTFSCYAKTIGNRNFGPGFPTLFGSARFGFFDLTGSGSVVSTNAGVTASIQAVGDGWYRCSITSTCVTGGGARVGVFIASGTSISHVGDAAKGLLLWGAQLEQSTTVGEYIPTTSTINSAPRFDHNPTTRESLGLLVEEQRTNSIRNNTMVGAVAGTPGTLPTNWSTNTGTGIATNVIGFGTENGISYIDIQFVGTATATSQVAVRFDGTANMSASASTAYTGTVYARRVSGSTANLNAVLHYLVARNSGGSNIGESSVNITSSLSASNLSANRQGITYTTPALTTAIQHDVRIDFTNNAVIDITIRIGLPQLEQGAFATSVIPTSGTAVTRSADVASISGSNFSSWYRQDEGTVYGDYIGVSNISGGTRRLVEIGISGGTNDRIVVGYSATTLARMLVVVGGTFPADLTLVAQQGSTVKLAAAFAANDFQLATNSSLSSVDSVGSVPSVSALSLGADFPGAANTNLNGTIRRLCFWPKRLPASSLAAITQ